MRSLYYYIRSNPLIIALSAIAIIQIVILLTYRFNGFFGQDSYEYLKTTRELITFYKGGETPSFSVFPGMYPFICSLFGLIIPDTLFVLQLVSLISLLLSFILLRAIIQLIYKNNKYIDVYLFLFFALSPYILRFSIISMSDLTGIALYLSAIYFSLKFQQSGKVYYLLFAGLFGGFSVMTRYPAIVIIMIPAVICMYTIIKNKRYWLIPPALILFLSGSLPDLLLRERFFFWDVSETSPAFPYFYFLDQYSLANFLKKDFYNLDGWQHYSYPNIIHVFQNFIHPAFIFAGFLFIVFFRKKYFGIYEIKLLTVIILLYAIFLAGNAYQSNRYLMFSLPLILILYYGPFLEIISRYRFTTPQQIFLIFLFSGMQLSLFIYSFRATNQMNRSDKTMAESVSALPENAVIYTFSIDGALKTYAPDVKIFDIYTNLIKDSTITNGYLLFNYKTFSTQFTDLPPMQNYQYLQTHFELQEIKQFESGWMLYAIR